MIVRIGISRSLKKLRAKCESLGAPMLISAGSLWQKKRGAMCKPSAILGADIALDSAGFTAMTVHGGVYPWTQDQYLDLVEWLSPAWYASRDYCVEPEIATNERERHQRIDKTAEEYHDLCALADKRGLPRPSAVIQGWTSKDYLRCGRLLGEPQGLVGVGSVCRRPLRGESGLASVLDACSEISQDLHLFGVKGQALSVIRRDLMWSQSVKSVDSHAWDYACRKKGIKTLNGRLDFLGGWYNKHSKG